MVRDILLRSANWAATFTFDALVDEAASERLDHPPANACRG